MLPLQLASDVQVFTCAAPSIPSNPNNGSSIDHIALSNGNLGEVAITNGNVAVTQRNKDAGTLVVADFVDDAMQHGENFVATCM